MKVNEYFDAKVASIAFENGQGRATSGVMDIGEYEFGTSENELMKVMSGLLKVKLPDANDFVSYPAGTEFRIAKDSTFQVKVVEQTAYLCFYT